MVACEAAASTRDYFRVVRSTCRRQPWCVRVKILFTVAGRLAACQFWEYVSVAVSARRELLPPPRGPICPRFVILTRATIGERPRDCGDSPRLPGFLLVAARMLAARSRFAAIKLHIACRASSACRGVNQRRWKRLCFPSETVRAAWTPERSHSPVEWPLLAAAVRASSGPLRGAARTAWRSG